MHVLLAAVLFMICFVAYRLKNMSNNSKVIYFMPCKPGSVYVNVTSQCLNDCLFCIKRNGYEFFGQNLEQGESFSTVGQTTIELKRKCSSEGISEIVFCGMGEPLLRYDYVLEVCRELIRLREGRLNIRLDTSGLAWSNDKRLDILSFIDDLSVSLNAENANKYKELCRPCISGAYEVLMDFLNALKACEVEKLRQGYHFPRIRLSVVDTSEEDFIPSFGRTGYASGAFPMPDVDQCKSISDGFGWPLIIKRLFRDSCDDIWRDPEIQTKYAQGIEIDRCRDCNCRH